MRPIDFVHVCKSAAVIAATMLALALGSPVVGTAQEDQDPASERATEFVAVEGPQAESVPGGVLMLAAYGAVWLFLLLYVLRLGKLSARAQADVARLEKSLAANEKASGEKPSS